MSKIALITPKIVRATFSYGALVLLYYAQQFVAAYSKDIKYTTVRSLQIGSWDYDNNFKRLRLLASSHNTRLSEQAHQNSYHSIPGSSPFNESSQFREPARPFTDVPTIPLPSLPAILTVGVPANPVIDSPGLENKQMELKTNGQSIISPQLPFLSRKFGVPIAEQATDVHVALSARPPFTEQATEVHAALPAKPPFKPLPAYSKQQVMTFGKKTLFSLLLGFDILANMLELTHVNFLYTTTLISFCTCMLLPGFLISLILRIRKLSLWENLFIIVGLSIAFLEFGGLLLNVLLPLFGVNDPLAFQNIVFGI